MLILNFFLNLFRNNLIVNYIHVALLSTLLLYFICSGFSVDYYVIKMLASLLTVLYFYSIEREFQSIIIDYINDDKSQTLMKYLLKIFLVNLFILIFTIY